MDRPEELLWPTKRVGLSFTMRCTAECAHCSTDSTPRTSGRIELEDALDYLEQFKRASYGVVVLTGGEPMLRYRELLELMDRGNALGLQFRMVSNGYWGRDLDSARRQLAALKERALESICISWDLYHEPYIQRDAARNVLAAAAELGIARSCAWVHRPGDEAVFEETVAFLREEPVLGNVVLLRDLDPADQELLRYYEHDLRGLLQDVLMVIDSHLEVGGRVARAANDDWERRPPEDCDRRCHEIARGTIVQPGGQLLGCCAPAAFGDELYSLGNLKTESFEAIMRRAEADPVVDLIRLMGPYRLYRLLRSEGIEVAGSFSGMCHLCRACLTAAGGREGVRDLLQRSWQEFEFERLLTRSAATAAAGELAARAYALARSLAQRIDSESPTLAPVSAPEPRPVCSQPAPALARFNRP